MSPKLGELFSSILGTDTDEALLTSSVSVCDIDAQKRKLFLKLESDSYIKSQNIVKFKSDCINGLQLKSIDIDVKYGKDSFCLEALLDIIDKLQKTSALFNGYLNRAEYSLDGQKFEITLKYGGAETIKNSGFSEKLTALVKRTFEIDLTVIINGEEIGEQLPPPIQEEPKVPVKAEEKPKVEEKHYDYIPKDGLPIYVESAKQFYGRRLETNFKPIIEITPEDTRVCVYGEVFELDIAPTKRGDKQRVNFNVSDHTNAVSVKMLVDNDRINQLEPLKNGTWIILNGDYEFDDWAKEFIVKPRAMATVQKYEHKEAYDGPARVELHAHTNMSSKDAIASGEALVKQAYKLGHKAIAITDHGVVQAFPSAAKAVSGIKKDGGDFKVIYGVEAYFVNDQKHGTDFASIYKEGNVHHQILLVKSLEGLKNLYKLVSTAHLDNFYKRPITTKSELDKHREGLIVGSACEQGELYKAIIDGKSDEELIEIASYYDYLEIQPLGNNEFMLRKSKEVLVDKKTGLTKQNRFKHVKDIEVIKDFNRKVVEIADKLGKMVVATGDVHFLKKEDDIIRKILMAGQGYEDFDLQAPLYLKNTPEMLRDFDYFGERAEEFVIENPTKIANMIDDDIIPVPKGN